MNDLLHVAHWKHVICSNRPVQAATYAKLRAQGARLIPGTCWAPLNNTRQPLPATLFISASSLICWMPGSHATQWWCCILCIFYPIMNPFMNMNSWLIGWHARSSKQHMQGQCQFWSNHLIWRGGIRWGYFWQEMVDALTNLCGVFFPTFVWFSRRRYPWSHTAGIHKHISPVCQSYLALCCYKTTMINVHQLTLGGSAFLQHSKRVVVTFNLHGLKTYSGTRFLVWGDWSWHRVSCMYLVGHLTMYICILEPVCWALI